MSVSPAAPRREKTSAAARAAAPYLQKPLTEMWAATTPLVLHVAVLQKTPRGPFAHLALLKEPLKGDPPNEFAMRNPPNVKRFGGDLKDNSAAVPLFPGTFEAACPSETVGSVGQLGAQLGKLITEIKGEREDPQNPVDAKPGLVKKANDLVLGLQKVR